MTTTPDLIESLAGDMKPVKRLRPPLLRAGIWLGIGVAVLVIVALFQGFRSDLGARMHQMEFDANMIGAVLTGILAAIACFLLSLPDRSRLWTLLPLPALILWMSTLGYQCLTDWVSLGPDGFQLGESVDCFVIVALTSLPIYVALLDHAAPFRALAAGLGDHLRQSCGRRDHRDRAFPDPYPRAGRDAHDRVLESGAGVILRDRRLLLRRDAVFLVVPKEKTPGGLTTALGNLLMRAF